MSNNALNVLINIVSSVLIGSAIWLTQWLTRLRKLERKRRFFGITAGAECMLVVNRLASSADDRSVHRTDVAALLELAAIIKECGAQAEVVFHDQATHGLGHKAEFCIGGPTSNSRTQAHLRWGLPGVRIMEQQQQDNYISTFHIGTDNYSREPKLIEYAILAKIIRPEQARPVFLICGQTAIANQAAVGYLVNHSKQLARKYGVDGRFCLVLRVLDPLTYGPNLVELVRDVTHIAFKADRRGS